MAGEYLKNSSILLAFTFFFFFIFVTPAIIFLQSQDCQCVFTFIPGSPGSPGRPGSPYIGKSHSIIEQYSLRHSFWEKHGKCSQLNSCCRYIHIYIYICLIYILSSFKTFGEIIQFSQLLIQRWVDPYAGFSGVSLSLSVPCSLSLLSEGEREKRRRNPYVLLLSGKWFAAEAEAIGWSEDYLHLNNTPYSRGLFLTSDNQELAVWTHGHIKTIHMKSLSHLKV